MSFHHAAPCIMTNTDQFYVRVCGCGVVHLNFGCTVVNVSPEAAVAISETLKEVTHELKKRLSSTHFTNHQIQPETQWPASDNVIQGNFPNPSTESLPLNT